MRRSMCLEKRMAQPRRKSKTRTTTHLVQTCQIACPVEWMQQRWLPLQLNKIRESNFPARRAPFENENRSMRNRRTQRQAAHPPRDKSNKPASGQISRLTTQYIIPIRTCTDEEIGPSTKFKCIAKMM